MATYRAHVPRRLLVVPVMYNVPPFSKYIPRTFFLLAWCPPLSPPRHQRQHVATTRGRPCLFSQHPSAVGCFSILIVTCLLFFFLVVTCLLFFFLGVPPPSDSLAEEPAGEGHGDRSPDVAKTRFLPRDGVLGGMLTTAFLPRIYYIILMTLYFK